MLPRGVAQKVTIYLNQDTRAHVEPLWSAVLNFLRSRHVAGATLFWADGGFGSHEQFHNPQSEYAAEHRPVRIEFIETITRVEELLPTLYEMVTDGLIAVQEVTVVKSVSKEKRRPEPAPPRKIISTPGKLLRIYLLESDKWNQEPLYEAIVKKIRMMEFAGATVYRGVLGYGARRHQHKAGHFSLSHDCPIMISVVEKPEKISELVQVVSGMMQDGIIVTSDVELHRVAHELPTQKEATSV
jgi:PII-like signaling protein